MVKSSYLYSCNHDFLNGQINVLSQNYLSRCNIVKPSFFMFMLTHNYLNKAINLVMRANFLVVHMVNTGYLSRCNHDCVDGQINLVLQTNYLDVIW